MDVNGSTGAPQPVPQALYVNNSALPSLNLQQSFIAATSLGQNQVPVSAALGSAANSHGHTNPPLPSIPPGLRGGATVQPGPPPALVPVSGTNRVAHINSYPPPYSEAVNSNIPRRPSQSQAQQVARPNTSQQSVTSNQDVMRVSLEAHQIRVGTRKFMPASNVVFKDDGVLFTLREYTHAPLLLNARAIIKCKANLNEVHPVLFFALEASCVKQIRSIFHMSEDEFNEKDPLEKKRCITVFPKSLTNEEASAIHHSFNSMKAKFGRVDGIVFPIDMDTAIDIIYGNGERPVSQTNNHTSNAQTRQPITNGVSSNARSHPYQRPQMTQAQHQLQQQQQMQRQRPPMQQQQQQSRLQQNSLLTSSLAQNNMAMPSMQLMSGGMRLPLPTNMGPPRLATQQPITIPQDGASFAMLQKTLQPNMIYPVVQPNDSRRIQHCVWTGTTFQPLPADEIRLHCQNVRVGSLRCQSQEPVVIKNQGSRLSIQFKLKVGSDPPCAFTVHEDELQHCFVCFQRISAMFLFPNSAFCQRVRYALKMKSTTKDPTFDNNSKEERQRHLILFLKEIPLHTKDEMLKLKRLVGQSNKSFISELDAQGALKILASIKSNTPPVQGKITDYMGDRYNANGAVDNNSLEALALEIATVDPAPAPAAPDDDDDDVIMTSEELTIKCPYTQQVMKEPVRNKNCSHNYEKQAIIEFIARRRAKGTDKTAKCPYAGCGNQVPLTIDDLEENTELKDYIRRKTTSTTTGPTSTAAS